MERSGKVIRTMIVYLLVNLSFFSSFCYSSVMITRMNVVNLVVVVVVIVVVK